VIFLAAIVSLSAVPYVTQLGFYSDDWAFLSILSAAPHQSFVGYFHAISAEPQIRDRPGQSILLSLLYNLNGLCPIGYHLFNIALFTSAITLLYLALREIRLPDATALAIALVYAFLPHYSTDRFWVAAFQANLSMAFCFLAFYGGLKSLRIGGIPSLLWRLAAVGSLLASLLSYETTAGIFLILPLVLWWRGRTLRNGLISEGLMKAKMTPAKGALQSIDLDQVVGLRHGLLLGFALR
jgi:hypothetical protein